MFTKERFFVHTFDHTHDSRGAELGESFQLCFHAPGRPWPVRAWAPRFLVSNHAAGMGVIEDRSDVSSETDQVARDAYEVANKVRRGGARQTAPPSLPVFHSLETTPPSPCMGCKYLLLEEQSGGTALEERPDREVGARSQRSLREYRESVYHFIPTFCPMTSAPARGPRKHTASPCSNRQR